MKVPDLVAPREAPRTKSPLKRHTPTAPVSPLIAITPRKHTLSAAARSSVVAVFSLTLFGCATNNPLRESSLAWNGTNVFSRPSFCAQPYRRTDKLIWQELNNPDTTVSTRAALNAKIDGIISPELTRDARLLRCWKTSYEDHQGLERNGRTRSGSPVPGYDLLVAEFDDQGERTDVSRAGVPFQSSEVTLIQTRLDSILAKELKKNRQGGLNIVVFTHGWHGTASATDDYSIWFKSILEEITHLEATSRRSICANTSRALHGTSDRTARMRMQARLASYSCSYVPSTFVPRRTVGIEIAWRGDSENIPYLKVANFWDRKDAAQTVAEGAVEDLLSRIHSFYIAHSCHTPGAISTPKGDSCDAVHLLTIGHSFGALIDFHALNGELSSGILGDHANRAYGFGDLTVMLNPAFEGEREETLWSAARARSYPTSAADVEPVHAQKIPKWPSGAQMPILVTLQSKGDWATHYVFPFARIFSSMFENTPGSGEYVRSLKAAGWVGSYQTLTLTQGPPNSKDVCIGSDSPPAWFCPFDMDNERTHIHSLTLHWIGPMNRPAYLPLWTVAVSRAIMDGHDDISNPTVVRFIAQLFRAAYEQSEFIHEMARKKSISRQFTEP